VLLMLLAAIQRHPGPTLHAVPSLCSYTAAASMCCAKYAATDWGPPTAQAAKPFCPNFKHQAVVHGVEDKHLNMTEVHPFETDACADGDSHREFWLLLICNRRG
jgi:hypothetical protein